MQTLINIALAAGAANANITKVLEIKFDREFRAACEQNLCGKFGKCWMCPPDVGDIDKMIAQAKEYQNVLVFQSIGQLEDSFDIEGMEEAAKAHNTLVTTIAEKLDGVLEDHLILGAGACHICSSCTILKSQPCAHPQKAIPSLEAYGIAVSELAQASGIAYMNGTNTVTYFGGVLFG